LIKFKYRNQTISLRTLERMQTFKYRKRLKIIHKRSTTEKSKQKKADFIENQNLKKI